MREVEARFGSLEGAEVDLLALPVAEASRPQAGGERGGADESERSSPPGAGLLDARAGAALSRLLAGGGFRGEEGETRYVSVGEEGRPDLLAVGTGPHPTTDALALRRAAGVAVRAARRQRARSVGFVMPVWTGSAGRDSWQAAAEGIVLGDWSYDELRGEEARRRRPAPPERAVLFGSDAEGAAKATLREAIARGRLLAEVQNGVRTLVAQPGNIVTPRRLASVAEELAARVGLECQAWGPEMLRQEGFGALLAVSRGSAEEPRFIILDHAGQGDPFVVVGKGVTFDSGGISIKPSSGMDAMKYDMAGAAAVLGTLEAVARLGLPHRVVGLIPCTENLPSGTALKPGDVIRGLSGTSIEVVNTDAEGRLILSDALTFALRLEPRAIVDVATLTGGCVVALGHHAIGLMTPDDALAAALEEAGRRSGERLWRLPIWTEYRKQLDSEIADLKNSGGREASTITGGWFLRRFVGEAAWAHMDIAGTAWAEEESGWQPKGATGVGVRLLVEWLSAA